MNNFSIFDFIWSVSRNNSIEDSFVVLFIFKENRKETTYYTIYFKSHFYICKNIKYL